MQACPRHPRLTDCAHFLRALQLECSQRRMLMGHVLPHETCWQRPNLLPEQCRLSYLLCNYA